MNAAGREDEDEKTRYTRGGEGHGGHSRELWVMSNRKARLMWSLIPDGKRIETLTVTHEAAKRAL